MIGQSVYLGFFYIVLFQVYRTDTYITYSTGIILTLRVLVLLNNTYITVQLHYLLYSCLFTMHSTKSYLFVQGWFIFLLLLTWILLYYLCYKLCMQDIIKKDANLTTHLPNLHPT